jgi:hypothetical protein
MLISINIRGEKYMKKFGIGLSIAALLTVAACGSEGANEAANADSESSNGNNEETSESNNDSSNEAEENDTDNNSENAEADEEAEEVNNEVNEDTEEVTDEVAEEGWETSVGETVENEGGTFTLHARQDDIDTVETGPVVMEIEQVNAASGELSPDLAAMMESENIEYVQMDITVENTGEEDITFYASQATIATSTGEQLESDMWMSDHIDGEMMSGTSHSGSFFFILENSNAEDIENVRITWSAPHDEDFNDIGEEVDIEASF